MPKPGTRSGAIEHKFSGRSRILLPRLDPDSVELLRQEAVIRREFGEEGVKRFWEEIEKRDNGGDTNAKG